MAAAHPFAHALRNLTPRRGLCAGHHWGKRRWL